MALGLKINKTRRQPGAYFCVLYSQKQMFATRSKKLSRRAMLKTDRLFDLKLCVSLFIAEHDQSFMTAQPLVNQSNKVEVDKIALIKQ